MSTGNGLNFWIYFWTFLHKWYQVTINKNLSQMFYVDYVLVCRFYKKKCEAIKKKTLQGTIEGRYLGVFLLKYCLIGQHDGVDLVQTPPSSMIQFTVRVHPLTVSCLHVIGILCRGVLFQTYIWGRNPASTCLPLRCSVLYASIINSQVITSEVILMKIEIYIFLKSDFFKHTLKTHLNHHTKSVMLTQCLVLRLAVW